MSYSEALITEKSAIIIDIGHAYTKCGFSGETGPHSIIPSTVIHEINQNKPIKIYDYKTLIAESNLKEVAILRELLIEFLYRIYYKILNVNSRERKVVIVESILTPTIFRQTLGDVLFNNFQAVSVLFLPSHLAALYTIGINVGLVLDCGYADCQVMPIAEGVPMTGQCDFMNLGGKRMHDELERLIKTHSFVTKNGKRVKFLEVEPALKLNESTLEDIKLRCCFISTLERSRAFWAEIGCLDELSSDTDKPLSDYKFKFAPDCDYNLYQNIVLHVPGYIREMVLDVLFVDNIDSCETIQNLIVRTLVNCPIDLKKVLSENVVMMGGTCMLEGFKSRLVSEVNDLLANERDSSKLLLEGLKYHVAPCMDNYTAWLGGAIFGHLDVLDTYSIQLANYKEMESLPDWFTISIKNEMVKI